MQLSRNHISLISTSDMAELKRPLELLGVHFFSYTRYYYDGTSICLLTHRHWYEFFLEKEEPGCINVFNLDAGCSLWQEIFPKQAVADARENFNIDNGIHFTNKYDQYIEAFSYASAKNDFPSLCAFASNIDLLENFNDYFKERASKLIDEGVKQKIIIPKIMRGYKKCASNLLISNKDREAFLSDIGANNWKKNLTKREKECLYYISRGYTSKKMANILNLSARTVEQHVAKLKIKLLCYNKSQLSELYWTHNKPQNLLLK